MEVPGRKNHSRDTFEQQEVPAVSQNFNKKYHKTQNFNNNFEKLAPATYKMKH